MSQRTQFILLFLFLFIFRTFFGFSQTFFTPDELQTYLIGLKVYCEHIWPFFGPDLIVTETGYHTQLPGALEGILVGGPFFILHIPEAPFLLLNLLSLSALALLSRYIAQRMINIPFSFIFIWLSLLPWNLHESTNIINPSWLLFGSTLFFIGLLEALPETTLGQWPAWGAFAAMGFGLFWDMQFHFSWILLLPFVVAAFFLRRWRREGLFSEDLKGFVIGSVISGAFLLSTWTTFGFGQTGKGLDLSTTYNWNNFIAGPVLLARYLSLVSYEIPRFLGFHTADRLQALKEVPWMAPPGFFLFLVGLVQPVILLVMAVRKDKLHRDAFAVSFITFYTFLMVWFSFWFTDKEPYAHIYYILIPLLSVYSFYIWDRLAAVELWRVLGLICLVASLWFEAGHLFQQMPHGSLYSDRAKVAQAIDQKNYHLLGERRLGSHN